MSFRVQIEWKILGELAFDNCLIFRKHLVIEIERLLNRSILVKIPADGNEEAHLSGGHGRCRVQDVKLPVFREKDRQFCGKREEDFKPPAPEKARWVEMFVLVRIIAHGADVICPKSCRGMPHSILSHNRI